MPLFFETRFGIAFGMVMPEREYNVSRYRFGYNGKEMDNEVKGTGNSLDFGARIYDPRSGRLLSLDPISKKFPSESNYSYAGNSPLVFTDHEGKKKTYYIVTLHNDGKNTVQKIVDYKDVRWEHYNAYDGAIKFYSADVTQTIVQTENGQTLHRSNESFTQSRQNYFAQKAINVKDRFATVLDDLGITDGVQKFGYNVHSSKGANSPAFEEIKGKAELIENLDLSGMVLPDGGGMGDEVSSGAGKLFNFINGLADASDKASNLSDIVMPNKEEKDKTPKFVVCDHGASGGKKDTIPANKSADHPMATDTIYE